MWKDPRPDCNLSSATAGWGPPPLFSGVWAWIQRAPPGESAGLLSQEVQRRACRREAGTWGCGWEEWEGGGRGDVQLGNLDPSVKTLRFILMELTSSGWISALGEGREGGVWVNVWGARGNTGFSFVVTGIHPGLPRRTFKQEPSSCVTRAR
uniref:Uncharacterized protein n=1 Tax=Pipistrellus kuhlii TaxID=59472 RepID=A0A7J7TL26_PIPKU|nr:hypothetical protein mPipKuh1_009362 [Pipistrellus kuhlii]